MVTFFSVAANGQVSLSEALGEYNVVIDAESCIQKHSGIYFMCLDSFGEDIAAVRSYIRSECGTTEGVRIKISWLDPIHCGATGGEQR